MLDAVGLIVATAVIAVNLTGVVSAMSPSLGPRLVIAAVIGTWVGLAAAIAAAGGLQDHPTWVGILFAIPLVATAGLALLSPAARAALLQIPLPLLVGLNVFRVFGALFLLLQADGRLAGPFPVAAGWGDIITGVLAVPVTGQAARGTGRGGLIAAWSTFGALDLVLAVTLGTTSTNGSPLQLIREGVGSAAMSTLPWSLIPTVLVPFYLICHALVFAQLWASRDSGQAFVRRGVS